ncbi:MAG: flagellar biosynthetic protein FliR [Burkholderiaceae bacterium]
MISVTDTQLYEWIAAFLWPMFRIMGLLATAPLLGDAAIPTRIKVGLGAVVTVAVAPTLGPLPDVPPASWTGLWIAFQQVMIGIAMGLVMRIVFAAVQTAGEFIGLQMGLSFASFFDPATGANTAVLSRFMNTMALLLFMAVNGHLLMLGGLVRTFDILPIAVNPLRTDGWGVLLEWSSQIMVSGMLLALPLIIILLTISLALGILNRTAQQLSVFAVGFPMSLLTGLVLLAIVLPQSAPFLSRLFEEAYTTMAKMAYMLAGG